MRHKNGLKTSLTIFFFFLENAQNLGRSDDAKRRKKRGWPMLQIKLNSKTLTAYFVDVFVLPGAALSTSLVVSSSLASEKRFFLSSMINQKFSLNVCSFPGFSLVEIKSDDGYPL